MEAGIFLGIVAIAGIASFLLTRLGRRGGPRRIPKQFMVNDLAEGQLSADARRPMAFLAERLRRLGFVRADLPVHLSAVKTVGRQLVVVPFVHVREASLFVMGIDSRRSAGQLMLHIVTPLQTGRRVETSTLAALKTLRTPTGVDLRVVVDADSIEEIWSRHRLALNSYERGERIDVNPTEWQNLASRTYDAWVQSGVRAQRLALAKDGNTYKLRVS